MTTGNHPKPVRIDGIRFQFEPPSTEPRNEALIYAFVDGGPSIPLQLKISPERKRFVPITEGWGPDSPYRKAMSLPDDIAHWQYELLTFTPEVFAPFAADISIMKERQGWLADILQGAFVMVRPEPRAVIEAFDPGMNYFFPMRVLDKDTGEVIADDYSYWVPRRRLWFRPPKDDWGKNFIGGVPPERHLNRASNFGIMRSYVGWEVVNNLPLRRFLADLPSWLYGSANIFPAMSAPLFRQLKSKGFTGLPEIMTEDPDERDFSQCIGHF